MLMECVIREWRVEDKDNLAEMLNNKNIQNNLRDGLPYPYKVQDAEEFILSMLSADQAKTFSFAITVNDVAIGSIGVFRCDNIHARTAEMGYYIGELYWGKGYGTSAVKQICKYVFEQTDIIRIFAEPFAYNQASCHVLEKAGFQFEGTLHSNAVKNGKVLDMKMYALLKADVCLESPAEPKIRYFQNPTSEFLSLNSMLDEDYYERFGEIALKYRPYNTLEAVRDFFLAYLDDVCVGCGCMKEYSKDSMEMKRIFVLPKYRRKGIAGQLIQKCEEKARDKGYGKMVLETGVQMPEAIALYEKNGYKLIDNFGDFAGDEVCVCMEKILG